MNTHAQVEALRSSIRDVPDFPKPGIVFKDITTLLRDPVALPPRARPDDGPVRATCRSTRSSRSRAAASSSGAPWPTGSARGSSRSASRASCPWKSRSASYELEYGTDTLEMHEDAVGPADRVLVVDDVIATGGTAQAVGDLCEALGASVSGFAFLVELEFLKGRARLAAARSAA